MGIIGGLAENTEGSTFASVNTNINNAILGSPLINIFGEMVGIDTSADGSGIFVTANMVKQGMNALLTVPKETTQSAADGTETEG